MLYLQRYCIASLKSCKDCWVNIDVQIFFDGDVFIALGDPFLYPDGKCIPNHGIYNIHQPLLRDFRYLFHNRQVQECLRNGQNVLHNMSNFEALILWNVEVSHFVAWNEFFLARNDVLHEVLFQKL